MFTLLSLSLTEVNLMLYQFDDNHYGLLALNMQGSYALQLKPDPCDPTKVTVQFEVRTHMPTTNTWYMS